MRKQYQRQQNVICEAFHKIIPQEKLATLQVRGIPELLDENIQAIFHFR